MKDVEFEMILAAVSQIIKDSDSKAEMLAKVKELAQ